MHDGGLEAALCFNRIRIQKQILERRKRIIKATRMRACRNTNFQLIVQGGHVVRAEAGRCADQVGAERHW